MCEGDIICASSEVVTDRVLDLIMNTSSNNVKVQLITLASNRVRASSPGRFSIEILSHLQPRSINLS